MKKKEVTYPIHKTGKHSGYDEYEDGSIRIAPLYADKMNELMLQEIAINNLLKTVTEQCYQLMIPIVKMKNKFWIDVIKDYSLDNDKYEYVYDSESHIILRKDKILTDE